MAIPTNMQSLSTTPGSNVPQPTDIVGSTLQQLLQAIQAILAQTQAFTTLAAAATTDLSTVNTTLVNVTGTASIGSLGTLPSGILRLVTFASTPTLVNSTNLQLPTGANYTCAAGDTFWCISLGAGVWKVCPINNVAALGGALASQLASYIPLAGNVTYTGPLTLYAGVLGGTAGNFLVLDSKTFGDANNDQLVLQATRLSTGSTWASAYTSLYRKVDSTVHAGIQFGDGNNDSGFGLGLGYSGTNSLYCDTSNNWHTVNSVTVGGIMTAQNGVTINNGNFVYNGATQPHVFVQSSAPTAIAVGDLWAW